MDAEGVTQFRAMWLTVTVHCFLFLFELFACEQLVQPTHRWILVFLPLNFVSLLSFFVCIWSVKRERPFEVLIRPSVYLQPCMINSTLYVAAGNVLRGQPGPVHLLGTSSRRDNHVELGRK